MTSVTDFNRQDDHINAAIEKLTRDQLLDLALVMEEHGGHFAGALATAFIRADPQNKSRILSVFGGIFLMYVGVSL